MISGAVCSGPQSRGWSRFAPALVGACAKPCTEQLTGACDGVGASSLSEQAVVADAVEALGQDVDQKAP